MLTTVFELVLRQSFPKNHRIFALSGTSGLIRPLDLKGREGLPYPP